MTLRERKTAAKQKFRAKQQELGLCLDCNNRPSAGRSRCDDCLCLRKMKLTERKAMAELSGVCPYCFQREKLSSHRLCENCYCRDRSAYHFGTTKHWKVLLHKFQEQQGICAISGADMILGQNAELDHIIPESRGGSNECENLQWVLMACNRMKDNLLEDEFFGMIEKIYHTMKDKQAKIL